MPTIKLHSRDLINESLADLRQIQMVPGVINHSQNSTPIKATMNEVLQATKHKNEIFTISGLDKMPKAMLSEVQLDPVSKRPIHFNLRTFEEGIKNVEVAREVALTFEGRPSWLSSGHVINRPLKTILVVGSLQEIPNKIVIDMKKMDEDTTLRAKDLTLKKTIRVSEQDQEKIILSFSKKLHDTEADTTTTTVEVTEQDNI